MAMTIIEGLKKLKLIEKRMQRNCSEITKYSSILSNEKPYFESEDQQRREVDQLIQANNDLEKEYCKIKAMIDYTNLVTMVQIDDENRSIHSWLTLLRKTGASLIQTYNSLTSREAEGRKNRFRDHDSKPPMVIRLYDENKKRDGQRKWEDLISGKIISGRLEVINATTELVELP